MTAKTFLLVRWLEEESVGVVPSSAVKKDQSVFAGSFADVKYQKKYYEAEILKISGE